MTTAQGSLFDDVEAARARDAAIAQAERHARAEWRDRALAAVHAVASRSASFTTDDIWQRLADDELLEPHQGTHEPRALGATMRQAVRAGLCTPTMEYRRSSRVACHCRPVRVWRSVLCQERKAG